MYSMQLEMLCSIEKLSLSFFLFKVQRYTFVANEAEKKTTFMLQNPKGAFLDLKVNTPRSKERKSIT